MYSIGADACKAGWFALRFREGAEPSYEGFPTAQDLWGAWGTGCDLLLIDVPIGLSDSEPYRGCDAEARRLLAPRASSTRPCVTRSRLLVGRRPPLSTRRPRGSESRNRAGASCRRSGRSTRQDPSLQTVVREVHTAAIFRPRVVAGRTGRAGPAPILFLYGSPTASSDPPYGGFLQPRQTPREPRF